MKTSMKGASRSPYLVIFDFDGVLVNSEEIINQMEQKLLKDKHGLDLSLTVLSALVNGKGFDDKVKSLSAEFKRVGLGEPANLRADLSDIHLNKDLNHISVIDGAYELLEALKNNGVPRAIGSNSERDNLRKKVDHFGFLPQFTWADAYSNAYEHVYSYQDTPTKREKPAPDLYLHIAREKGYLPHECIVIDDSEAGVEAAYTAGMFVIGHAGGGGRPADTPRKLVEAGADFVARDMHEAAAIVYRKLGLSPQMKQENVFSLA